MDYVGNMQEKTEGTNHTPPGFRPVTIDKVQCKAPFRAETVSQRKWFGQVSWDDIPTSTVTLRVTNMVPKGSYIYIYILFVICEKLRKWWLYDFDTCFS